MGGMPVDEGVGGVRELCASCARAAASVQVGQQLPGMGAAGAAVPQVVPA